MKKFKFILSVAAIAFSLFLAVPESIADAAGFKYKNYETGKTVKYTGEMPVVVINGKKMVLSEQPPFISSRGIAYASANGLFRDLLGLKTKYKKSDKSIKFVYHGHTLIMYVGKCDAYFDGKYTEAPCAPMRIKYKNSNIIATVVPSRFVSETFGFDYEWNDTECSINIEIPLTIAVNGEEFVYTSTKGSVMFEDELIEQNGTYSLLFSSNAMLNAETELFKKAGIRYDYNKKTDQVIVGYKDTEISYCLNSRVSYINGLLVRNPYNPISVYYPDIDKSFVYLPGRFTFENLGFYYNWNGKEGCSEIYYTNPSSKQSNSPNSSDDGPKLVKVINTTDGYKYIVDRGNCSQKLEIDLPMIKKLSDIDIREDLLGCMTELAIKGDYSEFFRTIEIKNTGEAILQIRIYYDPKADETLIRLYSDMVFGCKAETLKKGKAKFSIDFVKNLYDKVIVLDAGHGGHDSGAVGFGYKESDLNLKILLNCRELFKNTDVKVYYTRIDDTFLELSERAEFAGLVGADMFISIHHNSAETKKVQGTSVHYCGTNTNTSLDGLTGYKLAYKLQNSLLECLKTENFVQFAEGLIDKNFVVIKDSEAPAVLLEIGFISSSHDIKYLTEDSFSKKVARCIVDNVLDIYHETYEESIAAVDKGDDDDTGLDENDKDTGDQIPVG